MSDRDAFVEQLKARIDEWNAQIDKLEASAREAEANAKTQYLQQLGVLRKQRDEAWEQVRKAEQASEAAWDDMRAGFEAAWDNISSAFQDAMKRFH